MRNIPGGDWKWTQYFAMIKTSFGIRMSLLGMMSKHLNFEWYLRIGWPGGCKIRFWSDEIPRIPYHGQCWCIPESRSSTDHQGWPAIRMFYPLCSYLEFSSLYLTCVSLPSSTTNPSSAIAFSSQSLLSFEYSSCWSSLCFGVDYGFFNNVFILDPFP